MSQRSFVECNNPGLRNGDGGHANKCMYMNIMLIRRGSDRHRLHVFITSLSFPSTIDVLTVRHSTLVHVHVCVLCMYNVQCMVVYT